AAPIPTASSDRLAGSGTGMAATPANAAWLAIRAGARTDSRRSMELSLVFRVAQTHASIFLWPDTGSLDGAGRTATAAGYRSPQFAGIPTFRHAEALDRALQTLQCRPGLPGPEQNLQVRWTR